LALKIMGARTKLTGGVALGRSARLGKILRDGEQKGILTKRIATPFFTALFFTKKIPSRIG